ncbi:MAG TPA: ATP-binding cassette domain-containing protein [Actinomycetota bacterium]|nr:ATP-binding cassette domain-containing protein [Actinomycetota bacterium]
MSAIEFRDVTFRYPGAPRPALERVRVTIEEGAFALVTGPTGAGKSTLLRAVNGLVPHFSGGVMSGEVVVAGRSATASAPRHLADAVAFVPQDPGAAFVVDRVEDELAYGMENLGVPPAVMRRRVEETLDLLDVAHLRARSVRTLSGGERQRVAIAAALAAGPRVLVLDEPTSQLDPQGAEDVLAALQRLVHDLGTTVLLAEHRLERVAGFADVAVACEPGGRVSSGAPSDVLARAGSGPPVARLGRALGWDPVPLTVRDARRRAADVELPRPPRRDAGARRGDVLVAARALHAAYGRAPALRGVDVAIAAGEVVVLVGRNGAGKTTLLRCLAGLHEPQRGRVEARAGAPRPGVDVALCPQAPDSVLFAEDVAGEIAATRRWSGGRSAPVTVLDDLGIAHLGPRHPRDVSAGERALVAIAAVVATGAPVVLLDEPTRGLDPDAKARLARWMRAHAARGGAVVCATHDVELAAEVATRVVMLAGGDVVAEGAPEAVLGDSPVFSPQTARVFGPEWLTPDAVATALRHEAAR